MNAIPVITIDGPGGTGKGTIGRMLADHLGWHFLDSGSLYRVLAYAAVQNQIASDEEEALAELALRLDVRFVNPGPDLELDIDVVLDGQIITKAIRVEACGNFASKISALHKVRAALLARQRDFREPPGLVTDGRDMGTIVFPDAFLKFYLDASVTARAKRRYRQLKAQGISVNLAQVLTDIEQRDERDKNRVIAPLRPADDAIQIDTTDLGVLDVMAKVLAIAESRLQNTTQ